MSAFCVMMKAPVAKQFRLTIETLIDFYGGDTMLATWHCTPSGIRILVGNTCNIGMVDVTLKAESFDGYRCPEPLALSLSMGSLKKVLNSCKSDFDLAISATDGSNPIEFRFESVSQRIEMSLGQVNIEGTRLDQTPEIERAIECRMPSSELKNIVNTAWSFNESHANFNVCCREGQVLFHVKLGERGIDLNVTPKSTDSVHIEIHTEEILQLPFDLSLIHSIVKAFDVAEVCEFVVSAEGLLYIHLALDDFSTMDFYLCGKISE